MKKIILTVLVALAILGVASPAAALIPATDKAKENAKAPDNSPVIEETGSGEWDLERIDFIHYAKPEHPGKTTPKTPSCYKLLGLKWKSLPVAYVVNPTNSQGLREDLVKAALSTSAETWDGATSSELFNNAYGVDKNVAYGNQDFINALAFGDYPDDRVIGVTTIWYTPRGRQIVEFDILFNTRFSWGDASLESTKMDLQNIATHEFGHGAGLDDVYQETCSPVTMYGYSAYGETKKRSLEQPDITGIRQLYGM